MCSKVDHKELFFFLKFDYLSKHARKGKANISMNGVYIGKFSFLKTPNILKTKLFMQSMVRDSIILHLVMKGDGNVDKRKLANLPLICIC
jgi:hypothetical protein